MKQIFILIFSLLSFGNLDGQTNTLYTVPGDNFLTIGDYSSTNGTKGILFTGFRDIFSNYFGASIETVNSWVCCNGYPGSGYAGIKHIGLNFNIHDPSNLGANDKITAMSITSQGYIGIGTTNPLGKLHIEAGYPSIYITSTDPHPYAALRGNNGTWLFGYGNVTGMEDISIGTQDGTGQRTITLAAGGSAKVKILANGNVGIGTTNPDQKLTVNGKIHATEVIVDLSIPADYVFKPTYKLMPLSEVEQFVKANSHLPVMPSANEITKNGLSMGDMQNKLLQKVEELTLYAIQQNKKIQDQGEKLLEQEKKNKELETELKSLKEVVTRNSTSQK